QTASAVQALRHSLREDALIWTKPFSSVICRRRAQPKIRGWDETCCFAPAGRDGDRRERGGSDRRAAPCARSKNTARRRIGPDRSLRDRSRPPTALRRRARQYSVGIVDLAAETVAHRIAGLKEPQGVGYFPR